MKARWVIDELPPLEERADGDYQRADRHRRLVQVVALVSAGNVLERRFHNHYRLGELAGGRRCLLVRYEDVHVDLRGVEYLQLLADAPVHATSPGDLAELVGPALSGTGPLWDELVDAGVGRPLPPVRPLFTITFESTADAPWTEQVSTMLAGSGWAPAGLLDATVAPGRTVPPDTGGRADVGTPGDDEGPSGGTDPDRPGRAPTGPGAEAAFADVLADAAITPTTTGVTAAGDGDGDRSRGPGVWRLLLAAAVLVAVIVVAGLVAGRSGTGGGTPSTTTAPTTTSTTVATTTTTVPPRVTALTGAMARAGVPAGTDVRVVADDPGDWVLAVPGTPPEHPVAATDILWSASAPGRSTGDAWDCEAPAVACGGDEPPAGAVVVVGVATAGDIPTTPDGDWEVVLALDTDPAGGYEPPEAFPWHFRRGAERWWILTGTPDDGWSLVAEQVGAGGTEPLVTRAVATVTDGFVVFVVPADEVQPEAGAEGLAGPSVRYRVSVQRVEPGVEGSNSSDVTGPDPTAPYLPLAVPGDTAAGTTG